MNHTCAAGKDCHFDFNHGKHGIQLVWLNALQRAKAIHYASQAIDQNAQDSSNAGEEEYRCHGELDYMGDVGDVVKCLQACISANNVGWLMMVSSSSFG